MFQELIVSLKGSRQVYIENYKSLLDYRKDRLLIQGKEENALITGEDFKIEFFTNTNMQIRGIVNQIIFYKGKSTGGREMGV